jgi:anti-anti-sigma regulatory factor
MTTLCIVCAVVAAVSAMACGLLLALYKHAKRK